MMSDRLGYLLQHVLARLTEAQTKALEPFGLNGRDLAVLSAVASEEPLSQLEVAARLGVDRTSIGDLLDSLEERGLVERRRSPRGPPPQHRRPHPARQDTLESPPPRSTTFRSPTPASLPRDLRPARGMRLRDAVGPVMSALTGVPLSVLDRSRTRVGETEAETLRQTVAAGPAGGRAWLQAFLGVGAPQRPRRGRLGADCAGGCGRGPHQQDPRRHRRCDAAEPPTARGG